MPQLESRILRFLADTSKDSVALKLNTDCKEFINYIQHAAERMVSPLYMVGSWYDNTETWYDDTGS